MNPNMDTPIGILINAVGVSLILGTLMGVMLILAEVARHAVTANQPHPIRAGLRHTFVSVPVAFHQSRMAAVHAYEARREDEIAAAMLRHPSAHQQRMACIANHPSAQYRHHSRHGDAS